ncbi:hypothetical protein DPMN_185060 [Dreissena polymorpha]|uniref:Uncharacterized protein n=1 Tax=Dreissena polymorpha TaxID=45954 RepID=A0A9D4I7Z3_DREPO|nr:hypothetical protein DPMN_185060 [Dreissena polymorpha]
MPGDMFKTSLLNDYAFCDLMLEQTRSHLFEALKSNKHFAFDPYCELKRRVFRGKGDTIATKLANDIHALIGVMEGEDYSTIREIISGLTRSK